MSDCDFDNERSTCPRCGFVAGGRHWRRNCPRPAAAVGRELTALLAWFGIRHEPGCPCASRAAEMDRRGPDWCEQNIDTILGWLREEAERRSLPLLTCVARRLVKRAIRNARRSVARGPAMPAGTRSNNAARGGHAGGSLSAAHPESAAAANE